ncbi:MAG: hypothetical protein ACT4OJ_05315 [Bacteroidota bacterium]
MTSDNDNMNYKNLFRKNEERTGIPEFDDILNLPAKQKKRSSGLSRLTYVMIFFVAIATGTYYFASRHYATQTAKNEIQFMQDKEQMIWKWESPTQQLLTASLNSTNTNFSLPTDYLFLQAPSLKIDNNKNK